jgi:tRNA threonylcarbamoyl adenosine modification protein YjeE
LLNELPEKKKELIDLIIDAGELQHNEASTVVDTTLNTLNVLREGKLKFETSILDDKQVLSAHTYSDEETVNFGSVVMLKYIDDLLDNCLVLMLSGQLGTGKTQFTKGVAKQLKINKLIKSPTYTILSEYEYKLGRRKGYLAHIDTWKVFDWKELMRVGLERYVEKNNVLVVEWGDNSFQDLEQFSKRKMQK